MKLFFSDMELPKKITKCLFLAGPSPREKNEENWRIEAIEILNHLNFDGEVLIPITENVFYGKDNNQSWNYQEQIDWELKARNIADVIIFWIPRTKRLMGLTTNLEFGEDFKNKKIVYGRPDSAIKCKYLDKRIELENKTINTNLKNTIENAINCVKIGAVRQDGEVEVPLHIWNSPQFNTWYNNLKGNNNRLLNFKLNDIIFRRENIFYFSAKVNIWLDDEQREKSNESIFSRLDISATVLYYNDDDGNKKVVLLKEFRSPISNKIGKVIDIPSGSSYDQKLSMLDVAKEEVYEETSLNIEKERFVLVSSRQIMSSFLTHKCFLYKVELTKNEYLEIIKKNGKRSSLDQSEENGEINYFNVVDLKLIKEQELDYAILGMIYEAIY